MDLIYEHSNGAKLYQCGALEIPGTPEDFYYGWDKSSLISTKEKAKTENAILNGLSTAGVDMLILAAEEYQPVFSNPSAEIINIPFADEDTENITPLLNKINPTVARAVKFILDGKNVLSTCWAGINRSSLISGLILQEITDLSGKQIVDLIREQRHQYCLCNETFYWALI